MPAQTVIQIRRDTAANWTSTNPTLASGEIGFESDTNQLKVGNGTTAWTTLPYASGAGGASVEISETAPADPEAGDVWFNSTDGRAYIYYDSTWVDLNPGIAGPSGVVSVTSPIVNSGTSTAAELSLDRSQLPGSGNAIINGAFEINQRNFSSQTTSGYTFDRWENYNNTGTVTSSAQAFTLGSAPVSGYEAKNFYRCITTGQSGADAAAVLTQKIEDVRSFAGQTVTVSFYARSGSGTPKIAIELFQNFGTGGSPSAEVYTQLGAPTISTAWTRYTATVAIPSISGKTLGTTSNNFLGLSLWISAGSTFNTRASSIGIQANTFDIWGVQLEAGSTATPFRRNANSLQGELAACQRYYQEHASSNGYFASGSVVNSTDVTFAYPLLTTMRVIPSLSISAPGDFLMIGVSSVSVTNILAGTSSNGIASFYAVSSGLTAGQSRTLFGANANAKIRLSAEL